MIGEIFGNIEAGILMEAGAARALGKLKNLRRASDAVDDLEPSCVRLNKEIGDAASDAIAMRYPFALREVPFKTIGGPRIQDVVPLGTGRRVAIESKVGETALSGRIRQEVARDWWLLRQNQVDEIIWEFTPSPITRKGGPQPALLETLQRLGIKVRVNK